MGKHMKKVLLAGTALLGLALASTPAKADLNLDLGGHFRGYGVWNNNDDSTIANSPRALEFRRDTTVDFKGEATSDNGLTVGVYYEAFVGGEFDTEEAYAYFAGNWGRVNFGSEDGAAYLLQVAAPSADSNVDGLRSRIQTINSDAFFGTASGTANPTTGYTGVVSSFSGTSTADNHINLTLDYDHADFRDTDRITYLTPKYAGFQAGISYAPKAGQNLVNNGTAPTAQDNGAGQFENLWEAAARWDGEFEGFGISAGAGYSSADLEAPATGGSAALNDDLDTWNVGLNIAFQGFSLGGGYLNSDTAVEGYGDTSSDTWVVGAAWDNGPYHLGASYIDQSIDLAGPGGSIDADRWTVGAGYTYGPGMSLRGALAMGNVDASSVGSTDDDFTQVTLGTDIQF